MARSACDGWAAKRACEDQTLLIGRLADLIDDRKDAAEPLRCWVPACGQGEVAYEVAIMLAEAFGVDAYRRRFKIFATDANLEDQARARAGRLSQTTFQDSLAAAYVDQDGDGIKIKHAIRELMLFAEHDLCRDPPISRLDLIRCDHVFPDLDRSMKARLITLFHYTLNRGGYLWLDHTDSVDGLDDNFEILDARLPLLRRKGNERHFTSNLFPFGGLAKELEARRARKADTQHQLECDVEELRTLTEELQASFEETTAANEELSVLNQELLARSDVLRVGNERLEASEARYRSVVEDQSEYICRYQPDGTITFANGALCAALGLGRHQITGRNFADLWPGSTHPPSRLAVLSPEEPRQSRDFEIVSADGHACWQHWSDRAFFDRDGDVIEYQSVGKDITDRVAAEQQNQYLADHDQLTGLANRRGFFERAKEALAAARTASQQVAVHYLDLDQFKEINDGLGHAVGDALLLSVSHRLRVATRSNDTVARLGGDEFAVVQTGLDGIDDVVALANRLLASVRTYHDVADHRLRISVTIGIALFPNDGIDAETLLDIADLAMYEGKRLGGNRFGFFTRSLNEQVTERYQLRTELCEAFSDGQFRVHYQPIVNLKTHRICAIEALLRWQHPTRGLLCAAEFIDVLETISEIKSIGLWVLETACRQAKAWLSNADETMRLNVNLSGCMLKQPDLTGSIQATLEDTGFDPAMLELEITEHAVIGAGLSEAAARLCKLRDLGIQIALDDFGTGYSSLTFLRALPVGHIKIDRSFVAGLTSSAEDHAIVDAVIDLGRSLSLDVTAEGVEDREVLACLQSKQCDRAQGYLYGAAMTVDAIADLIGAGADLRRRTA
ncbi:MAG: EAL domain-containing protein [Alphaproteobacteria bacterium]|nr:EAL domain-containing protein [Alphaproteobacteria bacterium]